MKTHVVKQGETLSLISVRYFGTPARMGLIVRANPSLANRESVRVGESLVIPVDESGVVEYRSGLRITIGGIDVEAFNGVNVTIGYDAFSHGASLGIPVGCAVDLKRAFRPFSWSKIVVYESGEIVFSGVVSAVNCDGVSFSVSAFSPAYVLQQSALPRSMYPRQRRSVSFESLCKELCEPFGISVVVDSGARKAAGIIFDSVEIEKSATIADFLTERAKERGVILMSAPTGELRICSDSYRGKSLFSLRSENGIDQLSVSFDSSKLPSRVEAVSDEGAESIGGVVGVDLAKLPVRFTRVVTQGSGENAGGLEVLAKAETGRCVAESVSCDYARDSWRSPDGSLIHAGDLFSVWSPNQFVESETAFQIRTVTFSDDGNGKRSSSMSAVVDGSFSGVVKEFWR